MKLIIPILPVVLIGSLPALSGCTRQPKPQPAGPIYRLDLSGLNKLDLHSPDEAQVDDPGQKPGTDLLTLQAILKSMTAKS